MDGEWEKSKEEENTIAEEHARGGNVEKGTVTANLFQLWATSPEFGVAAESQLCSSLFSHLVKQSQNSRGEIHLPADFEDFKGHDGRAESQRNGDPFTFAFRSKLDSKTSECERMFLEYLEARDSSKRMTELEMAPITVIEIIQKFLTHI